jgi:hypothetical protein
MNPTNAQASSPCPDGGPVLSCSNAGARPSRGREVWVLRLVDIGSTGGVPMAVKIRRLLKYAGRTLGLRCLPAQGCDAAGRSGIEAGVDMADDLAVPCGASGATPAEATNPGTGQ